MSVAMFSSLGLPGLNGFIGEFLIFKGSFAVAASFTAVAALGLLVTAIVFMRVMQALFSGPLAESCSAFPDLGRSEKWIVVPVTLLMFAIGIAPQFVFNIFNTTVVQMARLLGRDVPPMGANKSSQQPESRSQSICCAGRRSCSISIWLLYGVGNQRS